MTHLAFNPFGNPTVELDEHMARERLAGYRPDMLDRHLLVLGAGAGGASLIHLLTQWGFHRATVVDFDAYEPANATRTLDFPWRRVASGGPPVFKVHELARHWRRRLRQGGREPRVRAIRGWLQELPPAVWHDADVVLACVDHPRARHDAVTLARRYGKPVIMGGFDAASRTVEARWFPADLGAACFACGRSESPVYGASDTSCQRLGRLALERKHLPATPNLATATAALMAQLLVDGYRDGFGDDAFAHRLELRPRRRPANVRLHMERDPECSHEPALVAASIRPRRRTVADVVARACAALGDDGAVVVDGGIPITGACEQTGAMLRIALPPWRCPRRIDIEHFQLATDADQPVVLHELTPTAVQHFEIGDWPAALLGWGPGARIPVRRGDHSAWVQWT